MRPRSVTMLPIHAPKQPDPLRRARRAEHCRFRCAVQCISWWLLLAVPAGARAEAAGKTQARLELVTQSSCASFEAIAQGVRQRTERVELTVQGQGVVTLTVAVH